ncbi:hypothetical protein DEO72_LG11g1033 [Vigna unguiculata]|uniref:GTD-binding domain-containing protein n=1 Tax=Vigna unguiculata TaxID=3917 RepID=A0A4D6NP81_VIGUN|nr:hypothetical protein DEO72_LG11g1033 [Vigna unguiculata]
MRCSSMISRSKSDQIALKETLRAQQQLLEKLYAELDEEREASATATNEALDMILRLQGEKAVVKMEASHYKRVAEEKIGHAEASLEAFEELMYQKEMLIVSLEFQVQAYRHKLMSLGCDLSANEFEFQEDLQLNRSDKRNGENGGQSSSTVRRLHSMPAIQFLSSLRAAARERSPSPVLDVIPKIIEEESTEKEVAQPKSVEFSGGGGTLDSYLNQIKELNEQVKIISDCAEGEKSADLSSRRGKSYSVLSQAGTDEVSQGESTRNGGVANDSPCLHNVYDVYEVPQTCEKGKRLEKWNLDAENRSRKPDSEYQGMVEKPVKLGATEKRKSMYKVYSEIKTTCPTVMMSVSGHKKEGMSEVCCSQAEFHKLNQRIERLERERISAKQEIHHEGNDEEQLRLLKDIQSQLQSIQSEMRDLKTKKAAPKDNVSLASLQEVDIISYSFVFLDF